MKYYMFVNPWNGFSCISDAPTTINNFIEYQELGDCLDDYGDYEGFFFESTNGQHGPWVHVEVKRKVEHAVGPYAKGSK